MIPSKEYGHLVELIPVLPFDTEAGLAYGSVRPATRERKADHLDKLIAAQAIAADVILVTNTISDFAAYPGLKIENWLDA